MRKNSLGSLPSPLFPASSSGFYFISRTSWRFFSRNEILAKLREYLPGYDKGMAGTYAATEDHLAVASQRSARLREDHSPHTGTDPYTDVDMLVAKLRTIVVKR